MLRPPVEHTASGRAALRGSVSQDLPQVVKIMSRLIEALFGCSHKNFSFPITKRRGQRHSLATAQVGTYVVCLDCGQEFAYDWQQMKVVYGKEGRLKTMPAKATEPAASK